MTFSIRNLCSQIIKMPRAVKKGSAKAVKKTTNEVVELDKVESVDFKSGILSKFKVDSKMKLKREHVTIGYDDDDDKSGTSMAQDLEDNKIKSEDYDGSSKAKPDEKVPSMSKKMKFNADNKPPHWEEVLHNLREMRKDFDAPVDSMGCDRCIDKSAEPKVQRYQSLLSLMLSSRTRDEVTYAAMERLKNHGCTVNGILATSDAELHKLIYPVAFAKNKVKFIKKATQMLIDEYDGDIPATIEDLCKLPGVGEKMAYLCMNIAWNKLTGIGVDTHVHRICNRLGWVNTKTPENTRIALEEWIPKELWKELNHLLVGFGQQTCKGQKPLCESCLNVKICPFSKTQIKKKK